MEKWRSGEVVEEEVEEELGVRLLNKQSNGV